MASTMELLAAMAMPSSTSSGRPQRSDSQPITGRPTMATSWMMAKNCPASTGDRPTSSSR